MGDYIYTHTYFSFYTCNFYKAGVYYKQTTKKKSHQTSAVNKNPSLRSDF